MSKRVCGTCYWHHRDFPGWICLNGNSEYYAEITPHEHGCGEWEHFERVEGLG